MIKFNIKFRFVCGVFAIIEGGYYSLHLALVCTLQSKENASLRVQCGNRREA